MTGSDGVLGLQTSWLDPLLADAITGAFQCWRIKVGGKA